MSEILRLSTRYKNIDKLNNFMKHYSSLDYFNSDHLLGNCKSVNISTNKSKIMVLIETKGRCYPINAHLDKHSEMCGTFASS